MSTQVLTRNHRVFSHTVFTATLGPQNIPVDHIIELDTGIWGLQNGTTAPGLSDIKAIGAETILNLAGREICRLRNDDIFDLDNLWFGQTPQIQIGGGDNYVAKITPMTLPLSLDKSLGGALRTLDVQYTIGTIAGTIDNTQLFSQVPYISNANVSWLPGGYHYAYQYRTFTATTTAQHLQFPRKGADLIGLLLYSYVEEYTSFAQDIDWATVYVNDQPVYGPVFWEAMRPFQCTVNETDDTQFGQEAVHYRYLDFSKAPLPADFLTVETASVTNTDANNRLIGIYAEP